MRIIRVLGAMTHEQEVAACDAATRLVRPMDTPMNDHTEHDEEQIPPTDGGGAPADNSGQVRFVSVNKRVVKVITRTVRRRVER
jgi:hypothetical protein